MDTPCSASAGLRSGLNDLDVGYTEDVRNLRLCAVFVMVAALASCGGGNHPTARPAHAPNDDTKWFRHAAPGGAQVLVGVIPPTSSVGPHPAVLVIPGTDALNTDYDVFG